ncbi:MAG: AMP-binding protein, partial [Planctomycetes bacterium]|nr:AMP-binding protein [Planctomycetota bacterium]
MRDLANLVRAARERCGPRPFFAVGERVLAGAEFAARVEAVAAGLIARGLRPGDRVAVLLERSLDEPIALLAAAVAGGIAVPVNGKLRDEQIRHVLEDSAPAFVVTSGVRLLALR